MCGYVTHNIPSLLLSSVLPRAAFFAERSFSVSMSFISSPQSSNRCNGSLGLDNLALIEAIYQGLFQKRGQLANITNFLASHLLATANCTNAYLANGCSPLHHPECLPPPTINPKPADPNIFKTAERLKLYS